MAHSNRQGLVTCRYQVRIPVGPDIWHRGCAYTVLQTVQMPGVYSATYGTVQYKELLKSFDIRVVIVPDSGFLLSWYCHDMQKATWSDIHIYMYLKSLQNCIDAKPRRRNITRLGGDSNPVPSGSEPHLNRKREIGFGQLFVKLLDNINNRNTTINTLTVR